MEAQRLKELALGHLAEALTVPVLFPAFARLTKRKRQPARLARYTANMRTFYDGMRGLGLTPYLPAHIQGPIIVNVHAPDDSGWNLQAFVDALKQEGVPVPSHEYVMTHGHAVCDFLTHQSNFAEAVSFVQRSSIWDANQSADFAAGAIVSYCPQYERASSDETQQAYQNALSDMQAIEGRLKGIQGDLQGVRDDLQAIPGHQ